jgi:hypothetical protein
MTSLINDITLIKANFVAGSRYCDGFNRNIVVRHVSYRSVIVTDRIEKVDRQKKCQVQKSTTVTFWAITFRRKDLETWNQFFSNPGTEFYGVVPKIDVYFEVSCSINSEMQGGAIFGMHFFNRI